MRQRRTKKEWMVLKEESLKRFSELDKETQKVIWNLFYSNSSKLNRLIRNTIYYLLKDNNLLNFYNDVYNEILFRVFIAYVVRFIENRYSKEFLEKVSVYNARHYTIYEIIKLKREMKIEDDLGYEPLKKEHYVERWKYNWQKVFEIVKSNEAKQLVKDIINRKEKIVTTKKALKELSKCLNLHTKVLRNLIGHISEVVCVQ